MPIILSERPFNLHFLGEWLEWHSVFSVSYTVHSLVFQHQRVKCTVVSNHSDLSLFLITEPKETAIDISSSGISARITIQKCSFGGRSERASSCHAALTLNIHISWYMFSVALCINWSDWHWLAKCALCWMILSDCRRMKCTDLIVDFYKISA